VHHFCCRARATLLTLTLHPCAKPSSYSPSFHLHLFSTSCPPCHRGITRHRFTATACSRKARRQRWPIRWRATARMWRGDHSTTAGASLLVFVCSAMLEVACGCVDWVRGTAASQHTPWQRAGVGVAVGVGVPVLCVAVWGAASRGHQCAALLPRQCMRQSAFVVCVTQYNTHHACLGRYLAGCLTPLGIYQLSSIPPFPVPGRFVQNLRQAAATQPTVTVRQGYVRRLVNGGWPGLLRFWD
jgi:hypothetical protein